MNKVLITGSEGSLMQAVIPKLLALNYDIVGVDNLLRHGRRLATTQNYVFEQGDLSNYSYVQELLEKHQPDYVIQAAAQIYGVGGFNKYCADILSRDVRLYTNVLEAAIKHNVKRIVYISSSMVYESCSQDVKKPLLEDMHDSYPAPLTEYGLSKFVGERLCMAFNKQYNLDYTIWRPFNIITPYEIAHTDQGISHVFADFINNIIIKQSNPLPIIGNGQQIRCFTWIDDIAEGIANHSFSEVTKNEIFNLGNPEPMTMRTLAKCIYQMGVNQGLIEPFELKFKTTADYKHDVRVRIPSVNKAKQLLGWEPTHNTLQSIDKCINYIKSHNRSM